MPPPSVTILALSAVAISATTACLFDPAGPLRPAPSPVACRPPTDDTSQSFSPWSQSPYCIRIQPDKNATADSVPGVYCVYTSSPPSSSASSLPFSHHPLNHTTSLITSPEQASSLLSSLTVPVLSPLFHQRSLPSTPAYRVAPIPGKGLGLVATRQLKKGEVFMVEYPALLLDVEFLKGAQPHHRRRLVKRGVERLGDAGRGAVYALDRKPGGKYTLDDVMGVNAVRVEVGEEMEAMGLWVQFSRINHDCQPNALYRFSPKTLALEVFPYRTIQPGEEITVSYTPITMPRDERRSYLHHVWGFDCSCALCRSTDDAATADSDHRRERVVELRQSVLQASSEEYYENALVMAREWLDVAEKEGIPPLMAEWYDVVARLSYDVGDLEAARRYALLAMNAWERFGAVDSADLQAAREWVRDLGRLPRTTRLETRGVKNIFADM